MLINRDGFPPRPKEIRMRLPPWRPGLVLAALAGIWSTIVLAAAAGRPADLRTSGAVTQAPPAAAAQTGGYAGDDTCLVCHESEGKALKLTLHGKGQNPRTPSAQNGRTCETCHGPGQAHAESGGDTTKIRRLTALPPREASDTCLTCHDRGNHANWKGGMHDSRNLTCITCHSIHNPKSDKAQLKTASVIETCATCHKTEVAKLQRSGHMPVREGKMTCVSCHNPHGTTNVRMLRVGNWINETCVSCHAEKRGPFLWDHAPVREACNTCHDPHGSNNQRMLVAKLPMLCQRCHIGTRHPSTIYDGAQLAARSNRLIGRGCVNCHAQIHGSNSPAGNAFLR
jgi:DmsE family decaheme c-type cytochrome